MENLIEKLSAEQLSKRKYPPIVIAPHMTHISTRIDRDGNVLNTKISKPPIEKIKQ